MYTVFFYILSVLLQILCPGKRCRSTVVSMSVCMSVCLSTTRTILTNVVYSRGSVLTWRRCNTLHTSCFVHDITCFRVMPTSKGRNKLRLCDSDGPFNLVELTYVRHGTPAMHKCCLDTRTFENQLHPIELVLHWLCLFVGRKQVVVYY